MAMRNKVKYDGRIRFFRRNHCKKCAGSAEYTEDETQEQARNPGGTRVRLPRAVPAAGSQLILRKVYGTVRQGEQPWQGETNETTSRRFPSGSCRHQ